MQKIIQLLKQSYIKWREDQASRLAAALAYYTIFSLAPLLLIIIAIAGIAWGQVDVKAQIIAQVQTILGESGAKLIQGLLENTSRSGGGLLASLIGTLTLILGALGVFNELQSSLNYIWDIEPKQSEGLIGTIQSILMDRLAAFGLILVIGLLLLVSLIVSTIISGLPIPSLALQVIDLLVSSLLMTLLFAMMYKMLPDAEIPWRDVWLGAAVTAVLFTIGKFLVGLYLGNSATTSAFGAAGSLALLLIWIYYSAQIILLGAEFTQVFANRFGSHATPEQTTNLGKLRRPLEASARPAPELERRYQRYKRSEPASETTNQLLLQPGPILLSLILASFVAGLLVSLRNENN